MTLSTNTTINELLTTYPFLVEFLASYNSKFGLLKNKVARATIGKMATLRQVAGIGGVPMDVLLSDIATEIEKQAGERVRVESDSKDSPPAENEKYVALKEIIRDLHEGAQFDEVKKRFDELVTDVEPTEIAAMEELLFKEGMPAEEVKRLADLHVGVFRDALSTNEIPQTPPGHPVHTFMLENSAFADAAGDADLLLQQLRLDGSEKKLDELSSSLEITLRGCKETTSPFPCNLIAS